MNKPQNQASKKIKIILFSFSGLVLLFIVGIFIKIKVDNSHLLNNGVRVKGAITYKNMSTASSKRSSKSNYEMELSLFIDSTSTNPTKPKSESFEDKMDALLGDSKKRMQNQFHEGYAKVTIQVTGASYRKYSIGSIVDVVHLKNDPSSAKLLEDIE